LLEELVAGFEVAIGHVGGAFIMPGTPVVVTAT
jgi:hypothetical protein